MTKPNRILIIEDVATDAELAQRTIHKVLNNCDFQVVENRKDFLKALKTFQPDVILSDYALPRFDGMTVLKLAAEHAPLTPVIIWTGSISEDIAVDCMKAGANNYILKENIKRLVPAVVHALEEKELLVARKQAEQHINELLAFNEKILNHSAVGIITYNVTGQCVFANEQAASIIGTEVAQLMAQNFRTIEAWKKSGLYDLVEQAVITQTPVVADIHHISTFGKEIWMTVHCSTFKSNGEDHLLVSMSDITKRKQTEEKLRRSENRYRLATQATNDIIWESDLEAKQLFWSENARTVLGYSPEEIEPPETWWDEHLHPDDRERVLSKLNAIIEGEETLWSDEYRFLLKNGSYAYISDRGYIERDGNGTPLRMLGAMSDITERNRAEEALRESENRLILALSGAQMSVWEWNLQTNSILWSPEFFEITGLRQEEFGGTFESLTDLIHEQDTARVMAAAEKAVSENALFAEEFRIIRPDGEVRWLSNLGHAEYDQTGTHLRLIGTVQDITQRKQAEIERQALFEIMQGLANTKDLQQLLKLIHRAIAQVIYAENFFIVMYQPNTGLFEEIYSVDMDQYDPPKPPAKLENSITSYVFHSGEPLLLTQVLFDELVRQGEMKRVGTNSASWLGVPLKSSGRTIGVMAVQDYEVDNRYSEHDKDFLASIAAQVALVIERRQTEEALTLFRSLIDHINDAIEVVDPETGRFVDVNERACQEHGYTREEYLALTVDTIDPSITLPPWPSQRTGSVVFESTHRRKDGSMFPVEVNLNHIRMDRAYNLAVVRDITERKRVEQALRESEEHYRAIFEGVQDAIFVESLDGKILMVNQRACEMFGYSQTEFLTKTVSDIVPEGYLVLMSNGEDSLLTVEPRETVNRRANGEIFPIEISGRLQVINGEKILLVVIRDITERKRAEEALRQSESRYRSLVENQTELIVRWKPDGTRSFVNEAYCRYFGLTPEEAASNRFVSLVFEADRPKVEEKILRLVSGVTNIETDIHRVIGLDGRVGWQEWTDQAVRDSLGNLIEFQSVGRDVTERKRAEEALRETETKYRTLVEQLPAVTYLDVVDPTLKHGDFNTNYISPQVEGLLGYPPEAFQTDPGLWTRLIHPDDREQVLARIDDYYRNHGFYSDEYRMTTRKGNEIWIRDEAITVPVRGDKRLISQGVIFDITERKHVEQALMESMAQFRTLFEASPDAIMLLDPHDNWSILDCNTAACQMNGYRREELIGQCIDILNLTQGDLAERANYLERVREEGILRYETAHQRKDGTAIAVEVSTTLIQFGKRDIILGIDRDITARKEADAELRASEERFRQLADNIQEVFWMTDAATGNELYMSPAVERVWGYARETFLSEPSTFINSVLPEDRPGVLSNIEKEKNGENVEMEYRIVRPDGSLRWVRDRAFPVFDETGRVKSIAGISADITERREAELALVKSQSRYRELFDSSPVSIWEEDYSLVKREIDMLLQNGLTDLEEYLSTHPEEMERLASLAVVTDANNRALEFYHVEKKDVLLKRLTELLSKDALRHFKEEILGLTSPSKRFVWEGTDKRKDGRQVELVVTGSIPHGYEEDWSKVIVSINDITERKRAEEQIRRRVEETAALLQTSLALTNLDLKAILHTIGNSAKGLFAADGCRIFLMEPDGETLRCVLALQESLTAFSNLKIKVGEGVTGAVASSGRAEIVNEMQNDPRSVPVPGTLEEQEAIMFAPLRERDRTIGVLSVRRVGTDRPFQFADLELLEALASMAASAVSNARLFEEAQRRLAELEALYENGLAVGRLLQPKEIGNRVIETFARYLPWHHVTIRLRRAESDDLDLVAFNWSNLQREEQTTAEQRLIAQINKVGQGLTGWVIQTGIPLRTGNVHAYPQYIDTYPGIQSGLYIPLRVGEHVIGVISVESEEPESFTEQDERLLVTLANQTAIAFENARLYETVQKELVERKRAEEALRSSETHYRELADSITDILFELDHDLRFTHWNKASEMLMDIRGDQAIGKSMRELFGESKEQITIQQNIEEVLKSRQSKTFETTLILNGEKRSFEINIYPSMRGVSVVVKDVAERKRSEIIMQKRFELMEYSARHSLDELMQRTVDEVSELTGSSIGFFHFVQEDQNTLGRQTWSTNTLRLLNVSITTGSHLELDQAGVWAQAVRERQPLIQNDYEALPEQKGLPQGHVPITREIVIPIIRNERVMAVMGIGNKPQNYTPYDLEITVRLADYAWDITERKQMEMALETERNQLAQRVEERTADLSRANSNLARALRVKDEFLANMSHELRTPLNAILGLSESLGEQIAGPLNEKQQKYISTISESGHHLLALINDILDLAKIEAGQITLDINKVDLYSVCQASLRMVKQLAQKKNQEVILEVRDSLGLIWADERRLKQMIVNLLGNAVKFTPENGKLGLEVHGDQEANKITFTVWDNGIGIKEDDLARLFQPFVQLDSGLAREATGTGLGLALVAQMARLHGGSVSAFSEPGKGSRFSIVLPWEPAVAVDSATRLRITGKFPAIKPDQMNKPRILLVEDTKEVVMIIRDYLELAGFNIMTAQDGVDAIVQAKLTRPDLILMDIQMPRMDGLEATRRLRSEPDFKHTPIIALTALAMPNDRERCLAAGMDEYISKPVNLKALVRIIQSFLVSHEGTKAK